MAFLGRVPGQLALRPVLKQTITPDGSASFTLDNQVSQNALDVFVNNVRQEPGVAYTVSGTTITFTEAPAVGSSVYIVYQKSVLGAEVLPGPDTLTTAMIKDGAITAAKLATSVDTHDSAAVQAQFDSAFPSAFDTRFALQDTHDSAAVAGQISATFPSITDSAGAVLIGTDSGDAFNSNSLLRIQQTSGAGYIQVKTANTQTGGLLFGDTDDDFTGGFFYQNNDDTLTVYTNNAERMRIDSSGNVGIGASSPTTSLDVEGAWVPNHGILSINATSGQYSGLTTQKDGTSYGYLYYDSANSALNVYAADTTALRFWTNNSERAMIDTSGTLGIATTPNTLAASYDGIQVQNNLWFTNNTNFSGFTQNAYYDGSYRYTTSREASLFRQINGRFDFLSAASGTADDAISFSTLMQVQAAGKVAINGTTADTTLHVHGSMMAGSGSSVGGADTLIARYSDGSDDQPNIIGTSRSSSAWYICYGLRPSTATADTFTSSVDNSTWYRGAFRVGGDYAAFRSNGGSAVNTAVGTTIATSEYVRMDHMGISFNGDTATANHLNDYEEGTWTPTVSTSSSVTVYSGVYTKIGNIVSFQCYIAWTNNQNNNSNNFIIGGLPFTSSAASSYHALSLGYVGAANGQNLLPLTQVNNTYIYFHRDDSTSAVLLNSGVYTRGLAAIIITGHYKTDL